MINRILHIWEAGGWVMIPLLILALLMFWVGMRLWMYMQQRQFRWLPETEWKRWVRNPRHGLGEVGEMIRYAVDEVTDSSDISNRFAEIRAALLPPIERQMQWLGTLVAAAPLVGLLGTVFGMLVTFQALASGGGGEVTEAMAAGISQALFPPEVGLCISLPGLILTRIIKRRVVELDAFLAQVESYAVQYTRSQAGLPFAPPMDVEVQPVPQPASVEEDADVVLQPNPALA